MDDNVEISLLSGDPAKENQLVGNMNNSATVSLGEAVKNTQSADESFPLQNENEILAKGVDSEDKGSEEYVTPRSNQEETTEQQQEESTEQQQEEDIPKTNSSFDIVDEEELDELKDTSQTEGFPDGASISDLLKCKQERSYAESTWSVASTCSNDTIAQQRVFADSAEGLERTQEVQEVEVPEIFEEEVSQVETPALETPAAETPAVETPAVETPAVETPAVETPAVETPAVETPAVETPAAATPAVETPVIEAMSVETTAAEIPAKESPAVETPAVETPAVETPAVETPAEETPAVGTPAVETPAVETPAVETPAVETPAEETPAVETPAVETPAVETPAVETTVETPAVETPAVETPAVETPAVETPAVETPASDAKSLGVTEEPLDGVEESPQEKVVVPEENEWVEILGNGSLKKKVTKQGTGENLVKGQLVKIKYSLMLSDGNIVDKDVEQVFQLGDGEVIAAIDLTANLAKVGELYEVMAQARFAYGTLGRPPKIGSNCGVLLVVEVIGAEDVPQIEDLSEEERMMIGDRKRKIGNDNFARFDYEAASTNYRGACSYLDPPSYKVVGEASEEMKDLQTKSWCNLALSELKQSKSDSGLTAINRALEIQPKSTKALYRKGKLLQEKGEYEEAEKCLKQALQLEPDNAGCKQFLKELTSAIIKSKQRQQRMYKKMFNLEDQKTDTPATEKEGATWLEGAIPMIAGAVAVGALAVAAYGGIKGMMQ